MREWTETFPDLYSWEYRVVRGGSFDQGASYLRAAAREAISPYTDGDGFGFRVVYLIPEPGTWFLVVAGGALLKVLGWRGHGGGANGI